MIVHILSEFPLGILHGGIEIQCLRTWKALRAIGVDARLLDYHDPGSEIQILHIFGNPPGIMEVCQAMGRRKLVISAVTGTQGSRRLQAMVKRSLGAFASAFREQTDFRRLDRAFKRADAVICLNQAERDFLVSTFQLSPGKLFIIPNGVAERFRKSDPTSFVKRYGLEGFVLFTGNLGKRKNPLRLARALQRLRVPGVFIGKPLPSEEGYFHAFQAEIEKGDRMLWIEEIDHESDLLASAYAAAGVFCLPSFAETQSLSALEAMAAGTPVVLGDRPYAYQEPFKETLRCDPASETSIANTLRRALADRVAYSHPLPLFYDWKVTARELRAHYEKLLSTVNQ
ncbi:MAG: glycosyltransferase family 4 protein [Cyanobacteria bacterium NC_groundwater_1444_Ag_S-0.65um_54_12]|nr:glycosyltransferase family 4 protein [Cyanobacteria bacterium NC_groundwater_1444_Ag_S-0.65um_54_12]